MDGLWRALRFMHVVPPLPRLMHGTFVCVVVAGVAAIALDPASAPHTLVPVLALQTFAVSTGFSGYVRRGYYDLLITGGTGRLTVACAQWVMAALPGLAAWLALATGEAVAGARRPELITPAAAAAMALVSTLPWACTVSLPRFSAAIGLFTAWITVTTLGPPAAAGLERIGAPGTRIADGFTRAGNWLGASPSVADGGSAWEMLPWMPALLVATVAMVVACTAIRRASFPLESGQ